MEITDTFYPPDRKSWRKWLEQNHQKFSELWLIYYKKHTGKPSIKYNDAVEEAVCFGWIDSTIKRIDDEKYAQKFTPRRKKSRWSDHNKRRAQRMIDAGMMAPAGLKTVENIDLSVKEQPAPGDFSIPAYIIEAIATNNEAFRHFNQLSHSNKKLYVGWIDSAKKEETRQRRLLESIILLSQGRKLPM